MTKTVTVITLQNDFVERKVFIRNMPADMGKFGQWYDRQDRSDPSLAPCITSIVEYPDLTTFGEFHYHYY